MTSKVESNNINRWSINWLSSWQLLSFILVVSFGGVGFVATRSLLSLPDQSSCNRLSLLFASATNRIYCAQERAEKKTVEDLLSAIALLKDLPEDHPLHGELNRYIKEWSNDILQLAQKKLDTGNLDAAIAIANKIPQNSENKGMIEEKIAQWREIWQEGEEIEAEVEKELRDSQWNKAFLVAVKLLNINNPYWQDIRYQQIVKTINLAREENKQLDGAYAIIKNGGIENLLETIEIASKIPPDSYSYQEAQKLIAQAEEDILEIAQVLVDKKDWYKLEELANEIATNSKLNSAAIDWKTLARAGKNVELGTISGVELAIAEAEQISSDSKIYTQARELIKSWSVQKEDLAHLGNARNLARSGEIVDLNAAIAKAQLVKRGTPIYSEAQREIQSWRKQVQILEDTPILAQARQFALNNDVQGWQNAINQASQISSNRALYSEARDLMEKWQTNIEMVEDRPILNEAISLGNRSEYQAAMNVASRIGRGRALYSEAQSQVRKWRIEITAQQNLDTAYRIAGNNDENSLVRAISLARRIPSSSSISFQSRQAVDLWSERLLSIAQRLGDTYSVSDLERAIQIAKDVPKGTSAYNRAQMSIREWNNQLYPSSPVRETPPQENFQDSLEETNFSN